MEPSAQKILRNVSVLHPRFVLQHKPPKARKLNTQSPVQNILPRSEEKPPDESIDSSTQSIIRRVPTFKARPVLPPRTETGVTHFSIGLTLCPSSTQLINSLRQQHSPASAPPLRYLTLLTGINDEHRSLCKQKISELASQLSQIELKIGPPYKAKNFEEKPTISCSVISEEIVDLRERLKEELKKLLNEAGSPKMRFGGYRVRKETEYWRQQKFYPRVGICVRGRDEEEVLSRILDEVKEKFPDGFGSLKATGLGLYWPGPRGLKKEPGFVPQAMEIPFSRSESEGEV